MDEREIAKMINHLLQELDEGGIVDYDKLFEGEPEQINQRIDSLTNIVKGYLLTTSPTDFILRITHDSKQEYEFNDIYREGNKIVCEIPWERLA